MDRGGKCIGPQEPLVPENIAQVSVAEEENVNQILTEVK